jgi:hypothetical protein
MKIKMLVSQNVAPNGINVERWMKDTVHEVDKSLGKMLIKAKIAEVANPIAKPEEKKEPPKKGKK